MTEKAAAGDVVERVMSRGCPISCSNDLGHSYTCLREHVTAALAVAREGYVSLEDVEDIVSTVIIPDSARELLIKRLRTRFAKPAEQTDVQKVEAILCSNLPTNKEAAAKTAAEIVAALRDGKEGK